MSNSCLRDSSVPGKRRRKTSCWEAGSTWFTVHAAVGLRMLLMGLAVGECLTFNCIFSMGLNKNRTSELIACMVCDCRGVLPVFRLH